MKHWEEEPELKIITLDDVDILSKSDNEFPIAPK